MTTLYTTYQRCFFSPSLLWRPAVVPSSTEHNRYVYFGAFACCVLLFFFLPLLRVHLWPVRVIQNVRAAKIIRGKQCNIPPEWWMKGDEKIALRFIKNDICIMSFGLRWWDVTRIYVFPTSPKGRHFWAVWFCVVKGHISVTIKLFWFGSVAREPYWGSEPVLSGKSILSSWVVHFFFSCWETFVLCHCYFWPN